MLTPPSSEPLRRGFAPWGGVAWLVLPGLLFTGSCFFDLPALEPDAGIGGNAGLSGLGGEGPSAGSAGNPGGSLNLGGAAGGTDRSCPEGEKLCGESCQPTTVAFGCSSSSCSPCLSPPGATVECREGQCAVTGCQEGFADCDGDTLGSATVGNGCEYSLGALAPTVERLDVPKAQITVDGSREDWSDVPAYAFEQLCANCRDQNTPPISADSSIPSRNDLDGRFRIAWDGDVFYVFVEAYDNHRFDGGTPGTEGCEHGAECEDSVQVLLAGRNNRVNGYGNDNHRLFLGLSNRFAAPAQGQPEPIIDVEIATQTQGDRCYRLEAKIDWSYITGTKGGDTAPQHFPPAPGQVYGFDIALNDWDPAVSDGSRIERQSQIFWTDPGPDFSFNVKGIGEMVLRDGVDAGP